MRRHTGTPGDHGKVPREDAAADAENDGTCGAEGAAEGKSMGRPRKDGEMTNSEYVADLRRIIETEEEHTDRKPVRAYALVTVYEDGSVGSAHFGADLDVEALQRIRAALMAKPADAGPGPECAGCGCNLYQSGFTTDSRGDVCWVCFVDADRGAEGSDS